MNQLHELSVDSALCEAIGTRVKRDRVSPEAWPQSQSVNPGAVAMSAKDNRTDAAIDAVILDPAWMHFRASNLDLDEAPGLANAVFVTVETREAHMSRPVSMLQRRCIFRRRTAAASIRIGAGQIRLPINVAMRLATARHDGPADLKTCARLAA